MTAEELIRKAESCAVCGEIHKPFLAGMITSYVSQKDGHIPVSRLVAEMSGGIGIPAALRVLAREGVT